MYSAHHGRTVSDIWHEVVGFGVGREDVISHTHVRRRADVRPVGYSKADNVSDDLATLSCLEDSAPKSAPDTVICRGREASYGTSVAPLNMAGTIWRISSSLSSYILRQCRPFASRPNTHIPDFAFGVEIARLAIVDEVSSPGDVDQCPFGSFRSLFHARDDVGDEVSVERGDGVNYNIVLFTEGTHDLYVGDGTMDDSICSDGGLQPLIDVGVA